MLRERAAGAMSGGARSRGAREHTKYGSCALIPLFFILQLCWCCSSLPCVVHVCACARARESLRSKK